MFGKGVFLVQIRLSIYTLLQKARLESLLITFGNLIISKKKKSKLVPYNPVAAFLQWLNDRCIFPTDKLSNCTKVQFSYWSYDQLLSGCLSGDMWYHLFIFILFYIIGRIKKNRIERGKRK